MLQPVTPKSVATARPRPRRSPLIVAVLFILLGVGVIYAPVISMNYTDYELATQAGGAEFGAPAAANPSAAVKKSPDFRAEKAYNAGLSGIPVLDPWTVAGQDDSAAYRAYLKFFGDRDIIARLRIPSIELNLPVRRGTSIATLRSGLGHLYGTSLPVGGAGSHAVFTGHSAMRRTTMFDDLDYTKVGDLVYIDLPGQSLTYRIDRHQVVLPHEYDGLRARAGIDEITMITCRPYGTNTHRLLVHATRVANPPETALEPVKPANLTSYLLRVPQPMYSRAVAAGIAVTVLLALIGWHLWRQRRQPRDLGEA